MHTLQLNIDDSIFDKFMGFLDLLPQDKIEVTNEAEYPSISFEEAKTKVANAVNNISLNSGISLNDAMDQVLKS